MAAVLGLATEQVDQACNEASGSDGVAVAANLNAPDQTVISGRSGGRDPRGRGLQGARRQAGHSAQGERRVPLAAHGAGGGRPARRAHRRRRSPIRRFPVIANASGEAVRTGVDAKRLLVDQLTAPVRWVACMQTAAALAPGATLRRDRPGQRAVRAAQADRARRDHASRSGPPTRWRGSSHERTA